MKLPIGIQTFEKLREGDYLYVDKTALVWRIASNGDSLFFNVVLVVLVRVSSFYILKLISKVRKNYLKGWP